MNKNNRLISVLTCLKNSFDSFSLITFICNCIPIVKWLPKYSIRNFLYGDTMSGITVAIMHIPQGMAYGLLAGVSPSCGLYMAFFPTLVYFAFGTSRHISVGTLSIVSLMTLKVVQTYASVENNVDNSEAAESYTPIQVVTATTFMCGIHLLIMYCLQLGSLTSLLNEPLVNGFTTGGAVHVLFSQFKDLFGIQIARHKGAFKIIYTFIDFVKNLSTSNIYTCSISLTIVAFMVAMNEIIKPKMEKYCRFQIPAELMAVIFGTIASIYLDVGRKYNVHLVGDIPVGLPSLELPTKKLLSLVAIDSIAIAIVSYSVTISMGLIFAKKNNYKIRPNQELLALGLSNIVGGLFSCLPNSTSFVRSLIQEKSGGQTQIVSFISANLILGILLWFGPFFEVLPRCVLSSIIVVALKGMYMQAAELRRFHREDKLQSITWLITFMAVVLIDVDIGLVCGVTISLITLYCRGFKSYSCFLGLVTETDVYVDLATHKKAKEIPFVKIFRFCGPVNFATCATLQTNLYAEINVGNDDLLLLVIDLSCVSHLDMAGMRTIAGIQKDISNSNITLILTCPNDGVFDRIQSSKLEQPILTMPTINDAVFYAKGLSLKCC